MTNLPKPSAEERRFSGLLEQQIVREIAANRGRITFERYMDLALYSPGLGYYSGPLQKFGEQGDFVTAPGLGGVFGRCLANSVAQVLGALDAADVLEFGAGDGALTVHLLTTLEQLDMLPRRYQIVEASAGLRQRQQQKVSSLSAEIRQRVHWLDALPAQIHGVVVANELLDAMPCRRFIADEQGRPRELDVVVTGQQDSRPQFAYQSSGREIARGLLPPGVEFEPGYQSELSPQSAAWLRSVGERLQAGAILLADYGFPAPEFYHPDRRQGTLMCHYRHHNHDDPFWHPGLQDITAHVDFTAIASAGLEVGLELAGYIDQANFLINSGLADILASSQRSHPPGSPESLALSAEVKKLTMPHEMGELFKVIGFTRQIAVPLRGFGRGNRGARLHTRLDARLLTNLK